MQLLLPLLLSFLSSADSFRHRRWKDPAVQRSEDDKQQELTSLSATMADCMSQGWVSTIDNQTYPWQTYFFHARIDHFTYSESATFKMRYFVSNCYYQPGGPIFLYTGNEGDLIDFALNTGIIWDIAPLFNASVIFVEHRFYGKSMPFRDQSYNTLHNLGYLTADQALADYADFLIQIKSPNSGLPFYFDDASTPVIAFGGSYGGDLAAWIRMKYPHLVTGSWASSAPLLYFFNAGVPYGSFENIVTKDYIDAGSNPYVLNNWWGAILRLARTKAGRDFLNSNMNLDPETQIQNEDDGWNLVYFIREGLEYMAMVDYPYPSSFLTPMPGFPVDVASQSMNSPGELFTDQQLSMMAYDASQVYYNSTGTAAPYCIDYSVCGDTATAGLGDEMGWPWQECSEIITPECAQGPPNDMFWNECEQDGKNLSTLLAENCVYEFGGLGWTDRIWNIRGVETRYGLKLRGHSNLILTQGALDPWSGGGYASTAPGVSPANGIYVAKMEGSAHHLDLRTPNTCDPIQITNMRYQVVQIIRNWISPNPTFLPLTELPPWDKSTYNATNCQSINFGYPWGQSSVPQASTGASTTGSPTTSTPPATTTSTSGGLLGLANVLLILTRVL